MSKPIYLKYGQQKEDPGKLVCEGYTAGSRSDPWWDWACNILSKKHSPEFINGQSMAMSSVFTLFYRLMCAVLPSMVLPSMVLPSMVPKQYNVWLHENTFPKMDAWGTMRADKDGYGKYYVQKGKKDVVFHHEKLAPPAGVAGANYVW